jgi:hypothetical protein
MPYRNDLIAFYGQEYFNCYSCVGFRDTTTGLSHGVRSVGAIWPRYPHNTKQIVTYTALTISYFVCGFGLQQIRISYVFSVTATPWFQCRHKSYSACTVSGAVFVLTTAPQRRIQITVEPRSLSEARFCESPVKEQDVVIVCTGLGHDIA